MTGQTNVLSYRIIATKPSVYENKVTVSMRKKLLQMDISKFIKISCDTFKKYLLEFSYPVTYQYV